MFYCQLLGSICFAAQQAKQSPEELVKFLTYQTGPPRPIIGSGIGARRGRAALQLVRLGRTSLPAIQKALDSIETQGRKARESPGARWLLYAYASIKQREAFPRLRRMRVNPRLAFLARWFDASITVSLQLTSFRSSVAGKLIKKPFPMGSPQETLDQFLLAWILNDQPAFEETLSPRAKLDLARLLKKQSWRTFRLELLRKSSEPIVAFGYRFLGHPPGIPIGFPYEKPIRIPRTTTYPHFQIEFYAWNQNCANIRLSLPRVEDPRPNSYSRFLIDTENIEPLLKELSPCLARPATTR